MKSSRQPGENLDKGALSLYHVEQIYLPFV